METLHQFSFDRRISSMASRMYACHIARVQTRNTIGIWSLHIYCKSCRRNPMYLHCFILSSKNGEDQGGDPRSSQLADPTLRRWVGSLYRKTNKGM